MLAAKRRFSLFLGLAALSIVLLCAPSSGWAAAILGNASGFAILAGASITSTGSSAVTGEIGVSPGTSVTGFPPGAVVDGAIHLNDGAAISAENDFLAAYGNLAGSAVTQNLTGTGNLGVGADATLTPGVYSFDSTAQLTGALTLDGEGDPNAQFIFLIGSTLTTASASSVLLTDGASFDNVFWLTGTAATLGADTIFAGSILAGSSITLDDGASIVCGRALAEASVTLITNAISIGCQTAVSTDVPEPGSLALLGLGFLGMIGLALSRGRNDDRRLPPTARIEKLLLRSGARGTVG